MEFSRPEYWSGQPFPSPEDLPNPGMEPRSPRLQADSLPAEPPGKPENKERFAGVSVILVPVPRSPSLHHSRFSIRAAEESTQGEKVGNNSGLLCQSIKLPLG